MIKLARFLQPYRMAIAMVLLLIFLQSLSELYLPTLLADIVNLGIVRGDTAYILKIGAVMVTVAAAGALCAIGANYLSSRVAVGFSKQVRALLFTHVENFSLQEFDQIGTASLITRTTNDIAQLQQALTVMLRLMVSAPLMCIGGIIMAVSRDAELSLVLAVVIPVLALVIYLVASRGIPLFRQVQVKLDGINRVLRENLTGVRVVRAFNRTDYEKERFDQVNRDFTATSVQVNRIMGSLMPLMLLIMNLSTVAILWFGANRIDLGKMQIGDLMAFIQYAMQILFALMMLSFMFVMLPRAAVSAGRVNEVLEMEPQIKESATARTEQRAMVTTQPLPATAATGATAATTATPMAPSQLKGPAIEFDHVTFRYPGAEEPVLEDVSFTAWPGETTAIIGGTGAGKSTLLALIPRFYDVDSGSIRVGGTDVRAMTQAELRGQLGVVAQKAVLFTGTVAENIRYGNEKATDEEVRQAARIAQAADFIETMPEGYDALIAQGGANLSGGQKQRLAMARAIVRRPPIYLFDDSFSALDYKTDAKLRAALKEITNEAAVLIVAQRVSTVMEAERIIVLDQGRVAGNGSHRELMATCAVYREIVASQGAEEDAHE
ncbi:ABC transporter ATP-binding protein [Heliophilum fasciatum]|uniref:ATP-binding cassette subfamily B protein n=1 Tax=Heliophilum fasciatum TaxID=35700 RepID=A0A4R2RYW6_9FIRM|nr:ABC transporter ATP-binding protein [Heliophilum fasciatum]MCW2276815.1 ATP-binding cassette subfamily B protein [Heliophilum fasciatum]TCP68724.1 ATP-binding cassette subfamily B protein [Heliophilum fasciatum]